MSELLEFSLTHNMIPIYTALYKKYPEGYPEILVFKDIPGKDIIHRKFPEGRCVYFVKEDTDDNILKTIYNEIENPKSEEDNSIPITYHTLSDKDVAKWCLYACYISDILKIDLKQLCFAHNEDTSGFSSEFITFIQDDVNDVEMLMVIAHELRHAWQHLHHPEWFNEYIHPEEDEEAYYMQKSEIDAEAFGIKVESIITGVEFINSNAGLDMEPEYRTQIMNRMDEIDVILSNKKINKIRKLIDLDGIFNSIR